MSNERVLVGMSGGVDSSAVCMMLQEQGYTVIGVTLRTWDLASQFHSPDQTDPIHIVEARTLAKQLGIEHHVADVRQEFKSIVVQNFMDEYLCGRTPNPCVLCNLNFKWKYLLQWADKLNCQWIATGHYARIVSLNNQIVIQSGVDTSKDQSYFLWRLTDSELQRTLFPLGGKIKTDIKHYVSERGYQEKAVKKESMEVCFIENDYREFLQKNATEQLKNIPQGEYINSEGKKLGVHQGFPYYTIGQRKGLGIALGEPAFVTEIDALNNRITLGNRKSLESNGMIVSDVNLRFPLNELRKSKSLKVRIRYRSSPIICQVEAVGTNSNRLQVLFPEPASGITPGQSAVFYINNCVVGGGVIENDLRKQV